MNCVLEQLRWDVCICVWGLRGRLIPAISLFLTLPECLQLYLVLIIRKPQLKLNNWLTHQYHYKDWFQENTFNYYKLVTMRDDPEATELLPYILQLVKAPSDFHGNCFFHYEFNQFSSTELSGPTEGSVPSSTNAFIFNCMYVCMHATALLWIWELNFVASVHSSLGLPWAGFWGLSSGLQACIGSALTYPTALLAWHKCFDRDLYTRNKNKLVDWKLPFIHALVSLRPQDPRLLEEYAEGDGQINGGGTVYGLSVPCGAAQQFCVREKEMRRWSGESRRWSHRKWCFLTNSTLVFAVSLRGFPCLKS